MVFVCLVGVISARADDWPQWRGPTRDSVWSEEGILKSFPPDGLKFRWRAPIGLGFSSPIVANGRVFLTDVELAQPMSKERVLCFDAKTGEPLWTFSYDAQYPESIPGQPTQGPIPTPLHHAGKVYTIGKTELHCLDSDDGSVLWKKSLDKEYQAQEFLTYASPLIEENLLIIYAGRFSGDATACVIAMDKDSGRTAWRAVTEYASMSSPIVFTAAGKRQLIVWSQVAVTSLDPATGEVHWREVTRPINQSSVISTPVAQADLLLVGGLMFKLDSETPTAKVLWPESKSPTRRNLSNTSTPMLQGDLVFSARTSGHLVCLDARAGEELWRNDTVTGLNSGSSIHLTPAGENTFLYTDRGELILSRLSRAGYEEISRALLLEPTHPYDGRKCAWAPPAFSDGYVYARSDKEIVCAWLRE